MKKGIFDSIKSYFEKKDMEYIFSEENAMFALKIKLVFDTVDFICQVDEKQRIVQLFSVLPLKCKADASLIAESFLEGINSDSPAVYGAFRLSNMGGSLGDVFYHLAFIYDENSFKDEDFEKYITHCLMLTDMNYLNIKRVFAGDLNEAEKAEYAEKLRRALGLLGGNINLN